MKSDTRFSPLADIVEHQGHLTHTDRAALLKQRPLTLWLTGLSGAGKSTLALALERKLFERGRAAYVLDGDNVRHGLNRDLGFSPQDRKENIRRIAEVARLMNDAGLIVITAVISPYQNDREMAHRIIGDGAFFEIYLSTPLDVCERRDPKGLYRSARSGQIKEFTGISAPYEVPSAPHLTLDTDSTDLAQCVEVIMRRTASSFSASPGIRGI